LRVQRQKTPPLTESTSVTLAASANSPPRANPNESNRSDVVLVAAMNTHSTGTTK
jgi:hypothetical protein